jgi:hypothetical protein
LRRAASTDANQPLIVDTFRKAGCSVQILSAVGSGCVDLLVGCSGVNLCVEVKDPKQPPSKRRLTPDQRIWHDEWRGQKCIVESPADAVALVASVRKRQQSDQ